MIIMSVSDIQENLDEILEEKMTVHITYDGSDEVVAVLIPIEEYEEAFGKIEEYE